MKKVIYSLLAVTLTLVACGPKIYTSSNFDQALAKH